MIFIEIHSCVYIMAPYNYLENIKFKMSVGSPAASKNKKRELKNKTFSYIYINVFFVLYVLKFRLVPV